MNYVELLDAIRQLNENTYFYGNEVLYKMAAESDILIPEQLSGAMWLIGRSYAASPQRRSYPNHWKVRPDNDGRDQFFSFIANRIPLDNLLPADKHFSYDGGDDDLSLLTQSAAMVLQFNLSLSKAIEQFDNAPSSTYCTNHISFCSKFLHFYYRHTVFIIDSYAQNGATLLFGGYRKNKGRYLCVPNRDDILDQPPIHYFKEDVYQKFSKADVQGLASSIELDLAELLTHYTNRKPDNAKAYIAHCVRSYLLGCALKEEGIAPSSRLAGDPFRSYPRLIDTVFLNIKSECTSKKSEEI